MFRAAFANSGGRMTNQFFRGGGSRFVRRRKEFNFQVRKHFREIFLNGLNLAFIADGNFH